mmetsp:Transcript_3144/g.4187  ORF Transcript_3144/g.4187 Transcript_3144/m.4187 type:complete len:201 (-) Transcript_3144:63-665(-)
MSEGSNKNQRIMKAAEALVQAASMEVDSVTQQKLSSNLDELKNSFDSKLNTVSQSMKASGENFDSKINTVNQHLTSLNQNLTSLKSEMEEVKDLLAKQEKRQKLEHIISSGTGFFCFDYYDGGINTRKSSNSLVKEILNNFALGFGYNLPPSAGTESGYHSINKTNAAFRTKLVSQLEKLIGHKPRLVDNGDGKYAVYYN